MAQMIKIKCNGPNHHVNEVDLDKLLRPTPIVRSPFARRPPPQSSDIPERLVRQCKLCTEGKVVISREIIEDYRRSSPDKFERG
jgi:hypothetical protein